MDFGDLSDDTKIKEKLLNFHSSIDDIERTVETALTKFEYANLSQIEKVNFDLFNSYTLNILCWMYLRSKGQDPSKTTIKDELDRIKNCMLRAKETQERNTNRVKIDIPAVERFIKHGINYSKSDADTSSPSKKRKYAEEH